MPNVTEDDSSRRQAATPKDETLPVSDNDTEPATAEEPEVTVNRETTNEDSLFDIEKIKYFLTELYEISQRQKHICSFLELSMPEIERAFEDQAKLRQILELAKSIG